MKKLNKKIIFSLAVILSVAFLTDANARDKKNRDRAVKSQWYVSTKIETTDPIAGVSYKGTNPVVIGKLAASKKNHDRNDIRPFSSLANQKAALIIIQDDWNENSGEYLSSYHSLRHRRKDSWTFTAVSNVSNADVSLKWDGIYEVTSNNQGDSVTYKSVRKRQNKTLKRLHLVDLTTGEVVDALAADGSLNSYSFTFNVQEKSRNFRWVLGRVRENHKVNKTSNTEYVVERQKKLESKKLATNLNSFPSGDKFGLPPQ